MDRKTAAESRGMDRQTPRDWVHRYNAEGLAGLESRRSPGPPTRLSPEQKAALAAQVEAGPDRRPTGWCAGGAATRSAGSRRRPGW